MAQTKYTYSVAADTLNAAIYAGALKSEIEASAIVTALDYITVAADVLDIYFKDALSAGDATILGTTVGAHTGVAPVNSSYIDAFPAGSFETRKYGSVAAYSSVTEDYTVTNAKELSLHEMGADAVNSADIKVEIFWDAAGANTLLFVTHGSNVERTLQKLTGNGTKVLRIKLTNDSAQSESIGGYWIGNEQ